MGPLSLRLSKLQQERSPKRQKSPSQIYGHKENEFLKTKSKVDLKQTPKTLSLRYRYRKRNLKANKKKSKSRVISEHPRLEEIKRHHLLSIHLRNNLLSLPKMIKKMESK